ncbi:Lon protease [Clostridium pasteurianum DSM 525 = ATCC 6013]|uniref:Lon protease n=1 Tax=Clostridium pasteurianum DSM 525 = ATCC 6013 TaxID=1262449 RepID=A0A0H3J6D4_CLOPA|nr:endopeptidase La [Clostridium pasteurianum]AJA48742.1 Lon protease [Clostridium pasteurianum DSM 525 = ATCC 6013]AJA52730.1 Lon protease [Clostridium pasteurianum DSM 525 = ATCC 6013]AOZ75965.1 peptidase [Clostridium pasteurianum DSM 525 = ATCC 6013]AOZ79761.1 peptidase [Clostridium pasteurianum]ELP60041.1 ATP-dependent protease La [Clostridium pasteurianum DSM 525 = ATCC 6013]
MSSNNIKILPLIPLRGIVIFPYMVMHFDVGREKSILALEDAMINEQEIFLVAQKKAKTESPEERDIYSIGTICTVKQLLKLPGNTMRVLVEGNKRAKINKYIEKEPFFKVEVEEIENKDLLNDEKIQALIRLVKESFSTYIKLSGTVPSDALIPLDNVDDPGRFADIVSSYLIIKQDKKQEMLEAITPIDRLEKVLEVLENEVNILEVEKEIGNKVRDKIDKSQKDYYLREQIKIMQEELGEEDEDKKEQKKYKNKIAKSKLPKEVKDKAMYELNKLKNSGSYSSEGGTIRNYLDWILDLPWNVKTKDYIDIKKAREILNKEHYGLNDVKDRIIEYLAVKKISNSLKGPILCLVGPPGVGKTSIARSIAHALNKNFVRMSLGGVNDEAEIRGHRRTYIGAIPGRIIYSMKKAKSKNPLFLLDEIDKMGEGYKGNPADALLEVLDSEQNNTFRDHYLELDFDLSEVMFVTTANTLDTIPGPLLDRMEIIEVSGYTSEEKFHIAKNYLIPKQLQEHSVDSNKIIFSDNSIYYIVDNYTRESGVRNLERNIAKVIRKSIADMVENDKRNINITITLVKKYLGPDIYTFDKVDKDDKVGIVTGMAWTGYGGDTLPVEVAVMPGSGKLSLTGQLGDVMKESAETGFSYVRTNASKYGINEKFYKEKDLHIHVPEGAVPKDGPSAGVTMITAMVSALTDTKVKHNIAMTGEITLTGRVLPIGGLKEKSLAAYRAGIDTVIIPKDNKKDLKDVPNSVKSKVNFILAEKVEDVIKTALVGDIDGNKTS